MAQGKITKTKMCKAKKKMCNTPNNIREKA